MDEDEGILVQFTDGTMAGYVVEELLKLRPVRERTDTKGDKRNVGEDVNQAAARMIRQAMERY